MTTLPDLQILLTESPAYYESYLKRVPVGDLCIHLEVQLARLREAFTKIAKERQEVGYAEGKWSPKEMMGHLLDVERVFQFRVFTIARGDQSSIPGMDEDEYVRQGAFNSRQMDELVDEFCVVRNSTILLLKSLSQPELARMGNANGKPVSARAVAAMIFGHPEHHLQVLKEKYF